MRRFKSILIPVPEADAAVKPFRHDDWSSAHGVPAHITLAGPWPLSLALPLRALGGLATAVRGTRLVLGSVGTLGDAVCLLPEDDRQLMQSRATLLEMLGACDGLDENWRFHLTVCRGLTKVSVGSVQVALEKNLPIPCEVRQLLLAQMLDDSNVSVRPL